MSGCWWHKNILQSSRHAGYFSKRPYVEYPLPPTLVYFRLVHFSSPFWLSKHRNNSFAPPTSILSPASPYPHEPRDQVPLPVEEDMKTAHRLVQDVYAFLFGDGLVGPLKGIAPARLRQLPPRCNDWMCRSPTANRCVVSPNISQSVHFGSQTFLPSRSYRSLPLPPGAALCKQLLSLGNRTFFFVGNFCCPRCLRCLGSIPGAGKGRKPFARQNCRISIILIHPSILREATKSHCLAVRRCLLLPSTLCSTWMADFEVAGQPRRWEANSTKHRLN